MRSGLGRDFALPWLVRQLTSCSRCGRPALLPPLQQQFSRLFIHHYLGRRVVREMPILLAPIWPDAVDDLFSRSSPSQLPRHLSTRSPRRFHHQRNRRAAAAVDAKWDFSLLAARRPQRCRTCTSAHGAWHRGRAVGLSAVAAHSRWRRVEGGKGYSRGTQGEIKVAEGGRLAAHHVETCLRVICF